MNPSPLPVVAPSLAIAPLRMLIVEDHAPTRTAIALLLEREFPRMVVIGTAVTALRRFAPLSMAPREVVVLDLDLDGKGGLELIPAIQPRHPR